MRLPGPLVRAAAGAWHVPAAFAFLIRRPSLWALAIVPTLLTGIGLGLGLILGAFLGPSVDAALAPSRGHVPIWLGILISMGLWIATLVAGLVAGLVLALLLSAPLLDRLSRRVEALNGRGVQEGVGAGRPWIESLKGAAYVFFSAPGVLLLGLVPLVGPVLGGLWGAHLLAFQETGPSLARRHFGFRERWSWHVRWAPESLGFGLAALVTLVVPVAGLLLAPVLAVGGTRLVLDLEPLQSPDAEDETKAGVADGGERPTPAAG